MGPTTCFFHILPGAGNGPVCLFHFWKKSIRRLYRLDYFEDIKVDSLKGSADDKMVLKIDVTEKPTGMFTFGAGYSSD